MNRSTFLRSHVSRVRLAAAAVSLVAISAALACGNSDVTAPLSQPSRVTDAVNDFIPTYTGPKGADLDVVSNESSFDGSTFSFAGTMNGAIGTTPIGVYVWGVDRGVGTARFGDIATGVHFDAVVIARPDGTGSVRDFTTNVVTPLPTGSIVISGNSLTVRVPAAMLPPQGFSLARYTVAFWPRSGLANNEQIADFSPDNGNAPLTVR